MHPDPVRCYCRPQEAAVLLDKLLQSCLAHKKNAMESSVVGDEQ